MDNNTRHKTDQSNLPRRRISIHLESQPLVDPIVHKTDLNGGLATSCLELDVDLQGVSFRDGASVVWV